MVIPHNTLYIYIYFITVVISVKKVFGEEANLSFTIEYVLDWYCHFLNDLTFPINKNSESILLEISHNIAVYRFFFFFFTLALLLVLPYGLNSFGRILSSKHLISELRLIRKLLFPPDQAC